MNLAVHASSPAAEALMSEVLRGGGPIAVEYPLVFESRFAGRIVALESDARSVLSACAILTRDLVVPGGRFRVGLIGSVVTDPDHRGRGYASEVLASGEDELAGAGCVCSLLWADDAGYYARRGYVPVGAEDVFVLAPDHASLFPPSQGVRPAAPPDAPALHALYRGHSARVDRSLEEARALFAAPGMTTLVVEREGAPAAYACLGRGADLTNVVHEWAGSSADVLALVRAHRERHAGEAPLVLMVPPSADAVRSRLELAGVPGARGVLAMAKLVSRTAAAELLAGFAGDAGRVEPRGAGVAIAGPAGEVVLSAEETLLVLFPPRADRGVVEAVEGETGLSLVGLPLTPFVWGLDSI